MTTDPTHDADASAILFSFPAGGMELAQAVTLDSRYPTTHNGSPVHLRWVKPTLIGTWEADGKPVNITAERVANWKKNTLLARSNGFVIPASTSHKGYKDPKNTLGFTHDARTDSNGELEVLIGYVGDDSLAIASKNYFSIGVEQNVRDAKGNVYDELLTHIASTPTPVLETSGFVTLSRGEPTEAPHTLAPQQKGVDMLNPELKARVTPYLSGTAVPEDSNEVIPLLLARIDALKPEAEKAITLATELDAAKAKVLTLSREDTPADPRIATLTYRAHKADVAADVASGVYSKATGDLLLSYVETEPGKPNTLLLSRDEESVGITFDKARELAKSARPGLIGKERTGVQTITLAREVPDAEVEATEAAEKQAVKDELARTQLGRRGLVASAQ